MLIIFSSQQTPVHFDAARCMRVRRMDDDSGFIGFGVIISLTAVNQEVIIGIMHVGCALTEWGGTLKTPGDVLLHFT